MKEMLKMLWMNVMEKKLVEAELMWNGQKELEEEEEEMIV